jgi:hypothetical protein
MRLLMRLLHLLLQLLLRLPRLLLLLVLRLLHQRPPMMVRSAPQCSHRWWCWRCRCWGWSATW